MPGVPIILSKSVYIYIYIYIYICCAGFKIGDRVLCINRLCGFWFIVFTRLNDFMTTPDLSLRYRIIYSSLLSYVPYGTVLYAVRYRLIFRTILCYIMYDTVLYRWLTF